MARRRTSAVRGVAWALISITVADPVARPSLPTTPDRFSRKGRTDPMFLVLRVRLSARRRPLHAACGDRTPGMSVAFPSLTAGGGALRAPQCTSAMDCPRSSRNRADR